METIHDRAQFHLDQARRALYIARNAQHARTCRVNRAYWQNIAAFHREEFARLARMVKRLDEYRASYGRNQRKLI